MKVKFYGKEGCTPCVWVKDFLNTRGITFEEVNVSFEDPYREQVIAVSGQPGVPVVVIDGHVIVGYQPDEMEYYLTRK